MCGICGIVYRDSSRRVAEAGLRRMADTLRHRGPDDEGIFSRGRVGLAARRLSIIDLVTGHQPIGNEDGTVWVALNGEIFNYVELRSALERRGHVFRTNTDTETLVHLYEEYGADAVSRLRGMFAFALWDDRSQTLLCGRDRFGIKPFYYCCDEGRFVFGSELKAVLAAGGVDQTMDPSALDAYFAFGYIGGDRSIFRSVRKLRPAHVLLYRPARPEPLLVQRYWDIRFEPDHARTEDDWADELEARIADAVRSRMVSDVPIGAFLSGGVDSAAVVAQMSRFSHAPVKTFSIGFEEDEYNELRFAREVARRFGTEHHEEIVKPESVDLIPLLVQAYDEPFADSSAIPTWHVSKFARKHVTVALSGDGGDELFAGYDLYAMWSLINRFAVLPSPLRRVAWGALHRMLPDRARGKGLSYLLTLDSRAMLAQGPVWPRPDRQRLYGHSAAALPDPPGEAEREALLKATTAPDFLSLAQELDLRTYLPDDILTKVDRVSMQNSLELRVPLLDHELAEFVFRIPANLKLRRGRRKYIFRKAMAHYFPPLVAGHRKQGFGLPLKLWFKDDLRDYTADRLLSPVSRLGQLVDTGCVARLVKDHSAGRRDLSHRLWSLLFLDAWLETNSRSGPELGEGP